MSALLWILGSLWLYRLLIKMDGGPSGPKLPRKIYRGFFLAGLFSALVLVSLLYGLWHLLLEQLSPDPLILKAFYHFLVVGPVEELSKFFLFFLVMSIRKSLIDPQSGMVQAGLTGLGFSVVENLYYIAAAQGSGNEAAFALFRIFLVGPGHTIYAMIWGGYYALEVWEGKGRVRSWGNILLALLVPVFAHGLYNTLARVHIGAALTSDLLFLVLALVLYQNFRKISPYRTSRVSEADLLRGLKLYPGSEELHRRLTHLYLRQGNWEKGLSAAGAWAQNFPERPEPCFLASWCCWSLGEWEKASAHLQKWNRRPHTALEKYLRGLNLLLGKSGTGPAFSLWCRQTLFGPLYPAPVQRRIPAPRTRWDPRRGRTAVT